MILYVEYKEEDILEAEGDMYANELLPSRSGNVSLTETTKHTSGC